MPSASLTLWRNDRTPRLNEVDLQCTSSHAIVPANPNLVDENIRGFILLLSAHFQGFCRDLYTECAQIIASRVRGTFCGVNPGFRKMGGSSAMSKQEPGEVVAALKIGDRVKIRNYAGKVGRIVELRGALGPGGAPIFRVLVQRRPIASYIELRGDQLEAAPATESVPRVRRDKLVPKNRRSEKDQEPK
jgi:hypothetical protein